MKKLLTASILVVGTVCSAYAADLRPPLKAPPPAPVALPPSWTGCYVEGGGGYGLSNIDHFGEVSSTLIPITTTTTSGGRGALGTVGGGCDYQFSPATGWGNWVVGVFGDYEFMDLHRNFQGSFGPFGGEEKESSAWAVGGRIGYLVTPNVFTYFNGGYTQTRFDQINFSLTASPFLPVAVIGSHDYHGWFLGGGTEISLAGFFGMPLPAGLFLRSEYRFASYDSANLAIFTPAGVPFGISENTKPYVQTITTSLVYRFNWWGH
jgi:outer membrane immunogenic protein